MAAECYIMQRNKTESFTKMGFSHCSEDVFDEAKHCELCDFNLIVMIATDEPKHAEVMKG